MLGQVGDATVNAVLINVKRGGGAAAGDANDDDDNVLDDVSASKVPSRSRQRTHWDARCVRAFDALATRLRTVHADADEDARRAAAEAAAHESGAVDESLLVAEHEFDSLLAKMATWKLRRELIK